MPTFFSEIHNSICEILVRDMERSEIVGELFGHMEFFGKKIHLQFVSLVKIRCYSREDDIFQFRREDDNSKAEIGDFRRADSILHCRKTHFRPRRSVIFYYFFFFKNKIEQHRRLADSGMKSVRWGH